MATNRLFEQWRATAALLEAAAHEIVGTPLHQEFLDFINHNELGLALDVLADVDPATLVSAAYWNNLCVAATNMGLLERSEELQTRTHQG